MTAKQVMQLYYRFLQDHRVTTTTITANILWLWPEYLRNNK
jgi:hypothetical protein